MFYTLTEESTVNALLWCSLLTSLLSILVAVGCVARCLSLASRVTRALNRKPPSASTLSKVVADVAELNSSFQSLARTLKRLSSRHGMAELREERANHSGPPPIGTPKPMLRQYYGLTQSGPEFARRQLQLVPPNKQDNET